MLENLKLPLNKWGFPKEAVMPVGFNWIAVLKDLVAGAPVTQYDHQLLIQLSERWPTCACGQLCKTLPRDVNGAPKDKKLRLEGYIFDRHIEAKRWKLALKCFYRIEARTAKLLGFELEGGE